MENPERQYHTSLTTPSESTVALMWFSKQFNGDKNYPKSQMPTQVLIVLTRYCVYHILSSTRFHICLQLYKILGSQFLTAPMTYSAGGLMMIC